MADKKVRKGNVRFVVPTGIGSTKTIQDVSEDVIREAMSMAFGEGDSMNFLVIHGPNLNMLGQRDQSHYGSLILDEVNQKILDFAKKNNFECTTFQSNSRLKF